MLTKNIILGIEKAFSITARVLLVTLLITFFINESMKLLVLANRGGGYSVLFL